MATAGSKVDSTGTPPLPHAGGALTRFLLPSLGAMLAAATLLYCLFVFDAGRQFFRDSDTGWHIRNGESILAHRALPHTDPYSFSKPAEPWLAWEWASDVVMGAVHQSFGLRGLVILFALTIAAATLLCTRLHFAAGGDFLLTALLAIPMVTTSSLHWLARPHVFSWLFLVAAVLYAERAPLKFGLGHFAAIAAAAALWANMHGSFFFAPLIALIYAASHLVRPLVWDLDTHAERMRARWFGLAAVAAAVGTLANPYGWRLHQHIFSYLLDTDLTSRIAEFQSFNFHDKEATQVALTVALAAAGAVFALTQKKLAHFLLMTMLVWGGLRSARILPLLALVALPLASGAFADALRRTQTLHPRLRLSLDRLLRYSAGLRAIDRRVNSIGFPAIVVLVSVLALYAPSARIGFPPDRFPVAAAQIVEKLPATARILTPDSFGGYLIYRFEGKLPVFFDGRSDFYGTEFMKQYLTLTTARPGWKEIVQRYQFTHALLPSDSPLIAALAWTPLYKDETATLLEAPPR